MKSIIKKLTVKGTKETVWSFFSNPANLKLITPPEMNFEITSVGLPERIYPGMIITYKVTPLLNLRMTWVTEITQIKEYDFFIDDQKSGPYQFWHHQHHFKEVQGGVEMTDIVTYKAPMGFVGKIMEQLVINRKVENIFSYREKIVKELFK